MCRKSEEQSSEVAMLEEFATDVSSGSIVDCAHWLPEERPVETADTVLKFLAS